MSDLVQVKFTSRYGNYNTGEVAGFSRKRVAELMKMECVVLVNKTDQKFFVAETAVKEDSTINDNALKQILTGTIENIVNELLEADGSEYMYSSADLKHAIELEMSGNNRATLINKLNAELEIREATS